MDHVAARLDRRHRVEQICAGPEPATRVEAAHLVRAEGVKVSTSIGNRDGHVGDRLAAIHGNECAHGVRGGSDLFQRCNGAEHVGDVRDRDHLRLQLHECVESIPENLTGDVVNRNEFKVSIHLARDLLPRDEVGVMLCLGDQHHVAASEVRLPPRSRNQVERFGGATEHH